MNSLRNHISGILLVLFMFWARPGIAQNPEDLRCSPTNLFKGETLSIHFPRPHRDWEFAIIGPNQKQMMLSFKPGPNDKIGPVIPPGKFARMKQIRIATASARGSIADGWHGTCIPRVQGQPERIFTQSGEYQAIVSTYLGLEDADFAECTVDYFNYAKPKDGKADPSLEPPLTAAQLAAANYVSPEPAALNCQPAVLYKGDTLKVDLPKAHHPRELAVLRDEDPYLDTKLISYKKTARDKFGPVIPFSSFQQMRHVELATATVKGSYAGWASRPCYPRVVRSAPETIFTGSTSYQVQIGPALGGDDADVEAACKVHYIDHPRPAGAAQNSQPPK